jgi:predicted nucleotidyltransferase
MMDATHDRIRQRLKRIEAEHGIRLLYACESGSRAWGFPSADSDYDVRFIYVRPRNWYLCLDTERQRDVIEYPIDDLLDINGWDLKTALKLFTKSNPSLIEWLHSPIVYYQETDFLSALRGLLPRYYSTRACFHHYRQMAKGNYRQYLHGDQVRLKKYFYVLRPLLALR